MNENVRNISDIADDIEKLKSTLEISSEDIRTFIPKYDLDKYLESLRLEIELLKASYLRDIVFELKKRK